LGVELWRKVGALAIGELMVGDGELRSVAVPENGGRGKQVCE
jgi:hypothetical protein